MAAHDQKPSTKGVMYVYKLDTGNSKHEPKPPLPEVIKKGIARSWAGVLRRSKTYRENDHELNRGELMVQEARKSVPIFDEEEEERKSVAKYEEGRKSVSSQLEAIRKLATTSSSSSPRVETKVASVAALLQVKIMVTDMPGFMQVHAFRCARQTYDSLEKFSAKHMAHNLKKEFDKVYGPAWHCIVGSSFGSFVTHATGCFLYFSIEKLYILVFKTKVQKSLN